jgi:RimJ/RimL family protein N-acetyltransferase
MAQRSTRPGGSAPDSTESDRPDQGSIGPDGTEPDGTEPDGTEPHGTEPHGTEPHGTEPVDLDPFVGRLVRLREPREEDISSLVAWWNDPRIAVFQSSLHRPKPAESVAEMIRGWSRTEGAGFGLSVVTKDSGDLVGQCALFGINAKDRCATFAIMLGPEHQNRGLGTDAIEVAIRFGFHELGLHRIGLGVYGFNRRAIAAYRKAGFVDEGRRRQAIYRSGAWHDEVLMGMLRADWEARHADRSARTPGRHNSCAIPPG